MEGRTLYDRGTFEGERRGDVWTDRRCMIGVHLKGR